MNARTELGSSTLHLAAQQGHPQVIYTLLDSGADPNLKNNVSCFLLKLLFTYSKLRGLRSDNKVWSIENSLG